MTRNEVVELALKAGMEREGYCFYSPAGDQFDVHILELERFATLVEQKVRGEIGNA